jgi:hypothetical protein
MDLQNMGVDEDDFYEAISFKGASKRLEKIAERVAYKILPIHQVR